MRALKLLVAVMTVLLVAGVAVIAVTIANRLGGAVPPFETRHVLPPGATVLSTGATADRVVVTMRLADGSARIVLLDPATGKLRGSVDLGAAP